MPATWPAWSRLRSGAGGCRFTRSPPRPARGCASWRSRWPPSSARHGARRRPPSRPGWSSGRGRWPARTGENSFAVRGPKPTRWIRQTDFGNDEAVGYLADRLARLGIEAALAEAGAQPGAEVVIGEGEDAVIFDWEPGVPAGAGRLGRRGTDPRLER